MIRTLRSGLYIAAALLTFGAAPALAQSSEAKDPPKPAQNRPPQTPPPAERPTLNRRPQPEAERPAPKPAPQPAPTPAPAKEQGALSPREIWATSLV